MRYALLPVLLLISTATALAQSNPANPGNAGSNGDTSTAPPPASGTPPADPRLAELDQQIELTKRQTALLAEQKKLQDAKNEALKSEYPIASVTPKTGDATSYENTSFLADWLLSANVAQLLPDANDVRAMECGLGKPTLVVGADTPLGPGLVLAESLHETLKSLTRSANLWVAAARAQAGRNREKGKSGQVDVNRESAIIDSLMMGQSVATQAIELIKYFRTDLDFKSASVSLPSYTLRSGVAELCVGSRLPEMAIPSGSPMIKDYIAMSEAANGLRIALATDDDDLSEGMKAGGKAMLATMDTFRTELVAPIAGQPTLLVQATQVLSQQDVSRILTVRVMDEGGAAVKRTNLFFLSPRLSYVATASADYVLTDRSTGRVLWHGVRQVRAQLNQKYSPWRGPGVTQPAQPKTRID